MPIDVSKISLEAVEQALRIRQKNKIWSFYPDAGPLRRELYKKHLEFFKAGASYRTRALIAGNRCGKSEGVGGYETTLHLTGNYPDWWEGKRFTHAPKVWAAGDTSKTVRDTIQQILLGKIGNTGTGLVPAELITRPTPKPGVPDGIESFWVKHASGGYSHVSLKSYDQGREAFQGSNEQDIIWMDEQMDESILTECVLRTMPTGTFKGGIIILTFTPLLGWTDVVDQFLNEERRIASNRYVLTMSWDDAPHLSEKAKSDMLAELPEYQKKARVHGIPELGSGAIYPIPDEDVVIPWMSIPREWPRAYGMDVGGKTAAVWVALNRDTDCLVVYDEYYREAAEPSVHAAGIKARGSYIPGFCDPAANQSSQIDGRRLLDMYRGLDLKLEKADNAVESGILNIYERMSQGRLKIMNTCNGLLEERRRYRRDMKGRIVKANDHRLDALRYVVNSCPGGSRMENPPAELDPMTMFSKYDGGRGPQNWMRM